MIALLEEHRLIDAALGADQWRSSDGPINQIPNKIICRPGAFRKVSDQPGQGSQDRDKTRNTGSGQVPASAAVDLASWNSGS
jgi:hypothetical protein